MPFHAVVQRYYPVLSYPPFSQNPPFSPPSSFSFIFDSWSSLPFCLDHDASFLSLPCEITFKALSTVRAPVFGRHQFFGTSEHYGKTHGSLLSGWMNYNYTACCWFPISSNILVLPSQFWQIGFESYWLHCSKCRILVLLRYQVVSHAGMHYSAHAINNFQLVLYFRIVINYFSIARCSRPATHIVITKNSSG